MIFNKDFVTNSSSTSFVLFTNDFSKFTLDAFYKACKVDKESPFAILYKALFQMVLNNAEYCKNPTFKKINNDFRAFDEFSEEGKKEIKKRIKNGEDAYVGTISDDTAVGAYFMGKKIIIIGDTFYFNWEPDAY